MSEAAIAVEPAGAVGRAVPRKDAGEKLRGQAQFVGDLSVSHMLHGKVLRSEVAHARLVSVDASAAERMPGVAAIPRTRFTTPARTVGSPPVRRILSKPSSPKRLTKARISSSCISSWRGRKVWSSGMQ